MPAARVEWLGLSDAGVDPTYNVDETLITQQTLHYDFGSATKYADNFGGGDWTIERTIGSLGACTVANAGTGTLIKLCFGLGMVMGPTSIASTTSSADLGNPASNPDLSWIVQVCCYVNLVDFTVEKCEWDVKSRRRISPESQLFSVLRASNVMSAGDDIQVKYDFRMLLRQRGSRV